MVDRTGVRLSFVFDAQELHSYSGLWASRAPSPHGSTPEQLAPQAGMAWETSPLAFVGEKLHGERGPSSR